MSYDITENNGRWTGTNNDKHCTFYFFLLANKRAFQGDLAVYGGFLDC